MRIYRYNGDMATEDRIIQAVKESRAGLNYRELLAKIDGVDIASLQYALVKALSKGVLVIESGKYVFHEAVPAA